MTRLENVGREVLSAALYGAGDVAVGRDSISINRLPASARAQSDLITPFAAAQCSGVRLELLTNASTLELKLKFTRTHITFFPKPLLPVRVVVDADGSTQFFNFDEGDVRRIGADFNMELVAGDASVIRFTLQERDLPRKIVVWFPADAEVELHSLSANRKVGAAPQTQERWVHYGSSISQCTDADSPLDIWPVTASRSLGLNLYNLGLSGSAHIDGFAARTIRDWDADLITLKMGINVVNMDSLRIRTFGPAVHSFLDTIRDRQATTPIVLISPIYCPAHETAPGPTEMSDKWLAKATSLPGRPMDGQLTLTTIRQTLGAIVTQRRQSDPNLHYMDGLTLLGPEDVGYLPDHLHPNSEGYRMMASRFADTLKSILPTTLGHAPA